MGEDHILSIDVQNTTVRKMIEACESKFGPITVATKNRCKQIAADIVTKVNKAGGDGKAYKKAKTAAGVKKSNLTSPEDAAWAADVLAPLGLRPGTQELAVRSPASVVEPILLALKTLQPTADLLKSTGLGIIVNLYRQHPQP